MTRFILTLAALTLGSALAATPYVSSDAKTKTATLIVNANEGTANSGLNFNGEYKNSKTFTVPAGWTVVMKFKNLGMMPHSAMVVKGKTPPNTLTLKDVAFPKAYSTNPLQGQAMNAGSTVKFVAKTPGTYNLVCGVPGHNLGGQYVGFVVSSSAKTASFK